MVSSCSSIIICMLLLFQNDFKSRQVENSRVREAYSEKEKSVCGILKEKKINRGDLEIFIRVFKKEQVLELWGRNKGDARFLHIKDYAICALSGELGPKRRRGDLQVPEGFYIVNMFNPLSNYYLSLGIDYPNKSDRKLSDSKDPGGSIFIHGACVTIGCIPITDDNIKELYIFALEAKDNGQDKIQVHIFPARLADTQFQDLKRTYASDSTLIDFWQNLKEGYDLFEKDNKMPRITVQKDGKYRFD